MTVDLCKAVKKLNWKDIFAALGEKPYISELRECDFVKVICRQMHDASKAEDAAHALSLLLENGDGTHANHVLEAGAIAAMTGLNISRWSDTAKMYLSLALVELGKKSPKDIVRSLSELLLDLIETGSTTAQSRAISLISSAGKTGSSIETEAAALRLGKITNQLDVSDLLELMNFYKGIGHGDDYISKGTARFMIEVYRRTNSIDACYIVSESVYEKTCQQHMKENRVFLCTQGFEAFTKRLSDANYTIREVTANVIRNSGSFEPENMGVFAKSEAFPLLVKYVCDDGDRDGYLRVSASYALWNLCACPIGATRAVREGAAKKLMDLYSSLTFDTLVGGERIKGPCVGILTCIAYHCEDSCCEILRDLGMHKLLHENISAKEGLRQPVNSALGLARLIGHIENHPLLAADTKMFEMFIECYSYVRRGQAFHGAWFKEELLAPSLARLAVSDSNKKLLKSTKCVEVACDNFKVGKHGVKVDEGIADLLSNMGFTYDLKKDFDVDCISILNSIKTKSESAKARKSAEIALFQIEQQNAQKSGVARKASVKPASTQGAAEEQYVMISYPWAHQEKMLKVKDFLEANGIQVWFDLDDMSGSTLDAMATAVEGASCVVMCLCPEYKQSLACHMEGEYAHKLRKPIIPVKVDSGYDPDGWLGIMIGNALYFDISSEAQFNSNCPKLVKEIHAKAGTKAKTGAHKAPTSPAKPKSPTKPATVPATSSGTTTVASGELLTAISDLMAHMDTKFQEMQDHFDRRLVELKDSFEGRLSELEKGKKKSSLFKRK